MTDNTTRDGSGIEYQDDSGLAGMAVGVDRVDGGTDPGIVRGTTDVVVDGETHATRVLVTLDGGGLVETDAERVEVV